MSAPRKRGKRERGTRSLSCPHCGGKSEVLRTGRPYTKDSVVRERRCVSRACGQQFRSLEQVYADDPRTKEAKS